MNNIMVKIRVGLVVSVLSTAIACTPLYRNHGYVPSDEDLAEILIGVDTRETVADVVGPPTAGGVLNEGGFYYVRSTFRTFGPFEPQELDREVVAIRFDENGLVQNVERYGLEDGQVVALSRRVTQDNSRDISFIEQMFGSFGRVNAGDFLE